MERHTCEEDRMKWMTYVRGIVPLQRVYPTLVGSLGKIKVVFYNKGNEMIYAWDFKMLEERSKEINLELAKKLELEIKEGIKESEKYMDENFDIDNAHFHYRNLSNSINRILGDSNIYVDAFDEFPCVSDMPKYSSYAAKLHNTLYNLKNDFSEDKLDKIIKEYWWTNLGWENLKPLTREDIIKRLDNITEPIEIVETGGDLASIFAELHDLRKELQMKSSYVFLKIIEVISKEKNIDIEDLDWLMPNELFDIDNFDISIIKKRRTCMFFQVDKKIELFYDDEAIKRGNELLPFEKSDSVKGKCVYHGKIIGIARICKGVNEAAKIKEGEILITGMTMPDYVPYMKKALAVVTNEGGLTCHAGIISREFKIPCVVGTIHATEIFKTGDKIEVDADNGVVRKL